MLDKIAEKILDNGLKIICLKKSDAPIIAAQVWYKSGSMNERDGIRGISHMLEHMMFRGSKNVASEEHAKRINDVGGHCNAFTMEDITSYHNSVPREHLSMVLGLEADRFRGLLLDKELFETERKVIIEEYHNYMNNPIAKAFLEFRTVFYDKHPYKVSPLGRIEDIKSMSDSDVRDYYQKWYSPDNAVIVIVGDFDSNESVFDMVEKHFGDLNTAHTNHGGNGKKRYSSLKAKKGIWMKRKVDFDVPILLVGYPAPRSASKDSLPLDILQVITSQGETSRLHKEIVRKKSLAVMAGGMNHSLKHTGMSLFFAAFTPDASYKRIESAINEQIDIVKKKGVTEQEMEKVKNITFTNRTFELFSAEHICQRIGFSETVDGDYRIWVKKLDELEKLNRDRLIEAARKYWKEENKYTLYLRPKKLNPLLFVIGFIRRVLPRK